MSRYLHAISKCLWPLLLIVYGVTFFHATSFAGHAPLSDLKRLQHAALMVSAPDGDTLFAHDSDTLYIPASLVKILTALIALDVWGPQHRFSTDISYDSTTQCMKVRGKGDPFLISEEIDRLVTHIKAKKLDTFSGIHTDSDFFSAQIDADGRGSSFNPYDAPYAALAANFNSIALEVKQGQVVSVEEHTPMTAMALEVANMLEDGEHRVSLRDSAQAPQYFQQILSAKLVTSDIQVGQNRCDDESIQYASWLTYENSYTLQEVVRAMLKYSNNFIAQQLFLMLGAHYYQAPASVEKSQRVFDEYIAQHFAWQSYQLLEGAGLSRRNQLSAIQIMDVLSRFDQYRQLLAQQSPFIMAKTGTMQGVRNYAGYLQQAERWLPFALIINEQVSHQFRERFTQKLQTHLNSPE